MAKYKVINNPLSIGEGVVYQKGEIVELDEGKAKAYGDDLKPVTGEEADESEGAVNYNKLKKDDLVKIADERGLDYDGLNKEDLIALLEENDEEGEEKAGGDEEEK